MPGTPYPLGPFTEGMNNEDEEATIGDNQLADIMNFELDNDGSLLSRPAIVVDSASPVAGQFVDLLGYYVRNDGATFAVCTTDAKTWAYDIVAKTYQEIWANKAAGFTQYDNKIVMISETVAGGYWEAGTFTSTPTMPLGSDIVLYQERLWAFGARGTVNQTTVWFSNVTSAGAIPTVIWTWTTATDFFEVSKGDGQWVTGLLADVNALIIFRSRSSFRLTFAGSVFSGSLVPLNATIGADNKDSFATYESYYLVLSQGILYQFINNQFYPLNTKRVRFTGSAPEAQLRRATAVSVFAHRAIVWYYGSLYVYSMNTNTWSRWDSAVSKAAYFMTIPPSSIAGDVRTALADVGINTAPKSMLRIADEVLEAGSGEEMTSFIRTKSYAVDEPAQYKRMFYWTFEVKTATGAIGIAYPSAIAENSVTTDEMDLVTTDVLDLGSVDNPLITVPSFSTDIDFPAAAPQRVLVKAIQDSRFMRIRFEIFLTSDGTTRTSQARIYSIVPYFRVKGGVAKKVS